MQTDQGQGSARASTAQCPPLGYPAKFEMALRYGEGPLKEDSSLSESDKLLVYALAQQSQLGPCKEPRPSMFDTVAKAKWNCWRELGNRSKFEAMFMYVTAIEEFAPDWWTWEPLGLVEPAAAESATAEGGDSATEEPPELPPAASQPPPAAEVPAPKNNGHDHAGPSANSKPPANGGPPANGAPPANGGAAPSADAPPWPLPHKLAIGGWSSFSEGGSLGAATARYRHGCAVVGSRLFIFGG